jgi:hypothetical protein
LPLASQVAWKSALLCGAGSAGSKARWISGLVNSKSKRKLTISAVQGSNAEDVGGTALGVGVKKAFWAQRFAAAIVTVTATTGQGEGNCDAGED